MTLPLLTLNCHEAWVHQLGYLDQDLHIIDGLPGRYTPRWDAGVRPLPPRSRLVTLEEVLQGPRPYQCIIAHSAADLLAVKTLDSPRVLVIHGTLQGRLAQEGLSDVPPGYLSSLRTYLSYLHVEVIATSSLKARSWGLTEQVVKFAADPDAYPPFLGDLACGLRVANQLTVKRHVLRYDLHEAAFTGVPVKIVGWNPDLPGVSPSRSWDDLRETLSHHRFFIHTAHPDLEDGYNMATVEAMAAGMPILGNPHPSSPVEHGVSGFLSDDPQALRSFADLLFRDPDLARRLGAAARAAAHAHFSVAAFVTGMQQAIDRARSRWQRAGSPVPTPP